jgi:imidazolonepropionase-like amidohydrolase
VTIQYVTRIDSVRSHGLKILQISVKDEVVMPGLIGPHVHVIEGGGEEGLFYDYLF